MSIKVETLELYIRDSNNMTIREMKKKQNRSSIVFRTLFKGISTLLVGGMLYGIPLIVGSYLSVASLIIDDCTVEFNVGPFVAVVLIIMGGCGLCCWIVFRLLALYPYFESLRFACSVLIAVTICGVHYLFIGAAVAFVYIPGKTFTKPYPTFRSFSQNEVYIGVLVGSIIYSCLTLLIALADTRLWFYRLSRSTRIIDELVMSLDTRLGLSELNCTPNEKVVFYMKEYKDFMIDYKTFMGTNGADDDFNSEKQLDKKVKKQKSQAVHDDPFRIRSVRVDSMYGGRSQSNSMSKQQSLKKEPFVSAV
jgi:hypothetical protein